LSRGLSASSQRSDEDNKIEKVAHEQNVLPNESRLSCGALKKNSFL